MDISKKIYDFFKDDIELSGAGSITSSLISDLTTIPGSTSFYSLQKNKNYLWAPEDLNISLSAVQNDVPSAYYKTNLFLIIPESGNVSFDSSISVLGKKGLVNGLINKIEFEWFGDSIKATVAGGDLLTNFKDSVNVTKEIVDRIETTVQFIDIVPPTSSLITHNYSYTVIAKDENEDIVAEACGNYWTSEYTYNSSTAYTNGSYSIVKLPGETWPYGYTIVKGCLSDDSGEGLTITNVVDSNGSSSLLGSNYSYLTTISVY